MNFLKNKRFIFLMINLVIAIILLFIIGYFVLASLNKYTSHDYYISVPELRGLTPAEAEARALDNNLQVLVIDSIYDNNAERGTIVEQFPSPTSQVKNNRKIQLTINANFPEKVIFPNMRNSAFRQTLQRLKNLGLNVGRIAYVPSEFKNLVLDFTYHGYPLEPGSQIQKGETIDMVLGDGNTPDEQVSVPNLLGKTLFEARILAQQSFLNIGEIIPDNTIQGEADQVTAIVYMQIPASNESETIKMGGDITLYLTNDKQKRMVQDSLSIEETQQW